MTPLRLSRLFLAALPLALAGGCGGSSSSPTPPSTRLLGVLAGNGASGSLNIDIASDNALSAPNPGGVVQAGGTWTLGGMPVNLTGTYDTGTKYLVLAGVRGGTTFTFSASPTTADAILGGGVTWGSGGLAVFSAFVSNAGAAVTVQCGSYAPAGGLGSGPLNLVLSSTQAAAVLFANTIPQSFSLTRSGSNLSGTNVNGVISVPGDTASGTFVQSPYDTTWSTSTTGC